MVSLDDAVIARWEHGGKRYEVLLDPDMVEAFREEPGSVNLDEFMAVEDVFHDARQGERPAMEDLLSTFGSEDVAEATRIILERGSIQLTTAQRKACRTGRPRTSGSVNTMSYCRVRNLCRDQSRSLSLVDGNKTLFVWTSII